MLVMNGSFHRHEKERNKLDQIEKTQVQQVAMLVRRKMESDQSGHDYEHVRRVVRNAQYLLDKEKKADDFKVLLACYLHDFYDEKLVQDVTAEKANLRHILVQQFEISSDTINDIFQIIDQMSFAHNLAETHKLSLEGQIVQDADRLDAIGAIGVFRAIRYGVVHGIADYDSTLEPREELTQDNYREDTTIINHFYEKLFKLEKLMNTKAAKRIARSRTKLMQEFVSEYEAEYRGEK